MTEQQQGRHGASVPVVPPGVPDHSRWAGSSFPISVMIAGGWLTTRPHLGAYHHPLRFAQTSRAADITAMTASSTASANQCVELLTITFIPRTEDSAVIGRVTAAITASRSAAMVNLVLVRVW